MSGAIKLTVVIALLALVACCLVGLVVDAIAHTRRRRWWDANAERVAGDPGAPEELRATARRIIRIRNQPDPQVKYERIMGQYKTYRKEHDS